MMKFLKTIKLACFGSLLAAGLVNASTQCNGFEIKIKNNLSDKLLANIQMIGADIQPRNITKMNEKSDVVFSISNTSKKMNAEFVFQTVSIPSKEIRIRFDLSNGLLRCDHDDKTGKQSGGIPIDQSRSIGKVTYTIGK